MSAFAANRQQLWIYGVPGDVGGAATKIRDLVRLLGTLLDICVILPSRQYLKNPDILRQLKRLPCSFIWFDDLKKRQGAVCLAVCESAFFRSGHAAKLKDLGFKVIFSNEMMWSFDGERDACKDGLVDKVLYVSKFQKAALAESNSGTPFAYTSNYVHAESFPYTKRNHWPMAIGRISRADPQKYSENFPAFYESICPFDANFRVMGWDAKCAAKFNWFEFGPRWTLLTMNAKPVVDFLAEIDFFVYSTDRKLHESWGRAVVESMLTGCIPLLPTGHAFEEFITIGESGYICFDATEYRSILSMLYQDVGVRNAVSRRAAEVARDVICSPSKHSEIWINALFG
jgi:hypothetical protein